MLNENFKNTAKIMPPFDSNAEKQARDFVEKLKRDLTNAQNGQVFGFLLTGKTGVGKSSTINTLIGKQVAPVGDYVATTIKIENYECNMNGVEVIITDTPGLCDDLEEAGNDYKYLEMMRSQVNQIDSMWFVTRLDDTRVSTDEKKGIKLISEAFKNKIWEQAIIVFTFADNLNPEKYPIALDKRTELIRKEIAKYAGIAISNNIPAVAVTNENIYTPDGNKWLGELFTQVYCRLSREGVAPFLMSTVNRIKPPEKEKEIVYVEVPAKPTYDQKIELTDKQVGLIAEKTWADYAAFASIYGATGAVVGAAAGPVGAAVGGVVGAALGLLQAWLTPH